MGSRELRKRGTYPGIYTVPKTRQISEKIREEVPWRENFPVIRGNGDYFPSITGKFSLQESSSSLPTKIYTIIGTVYQANWWKHFHTYI
jgi:hypothetical protein